MAIMSLLSDTKWPIAGVLVLLFVVKMLVDYNRLRHFKGPPSTGFSNYLHSKAFLSGKCHKWYTEVNETYGPLARIGPNILLTSSPEIWTRLNAVRSPYKRSKWFYQAARIEYGRDNVFSMVDDEAHDKRRKQMAPGYSGKENTELEPNIDKCVQAFLNLIRTKYLSNDSEIKPIEFSQKAQYFTLDVISLVGLGKSFGMIQADKDVEGFIQSMDEGLKIANVMCALGLSWIAQSPVVGPLLGPSPKDASGFGKMMGTAFKFVDERAAKATDFKSDMLASFIRHGITGDQLRSEALEQVAAGSDTTAGAIRSIILHILTNPRVYKKLQSEIDDAVKTGRSPAPPDIISMAQAKEIPYLQAVIREGLRIWPPVVDIFPRDIPPGGETWTVDGKEVFLPGGTNVGYSGESMHHNKALYGEDSASFRPERWFEEDAEKLNAMIRTNEMIFGHGKFQCLGKPVAQIEISKLVFELFRNFNWGLENPTSPWTATNLLGLFVIDDMWVHATER